MAFGKFSTLMHAMGGTVMSHQTPEDIQVLLFYYKKYVTNSTNSQSPFRYGYGGTLSNRKVSLMSNINICVGQAIHLGHPKSFNTTQNMNSVLLSSMRVPGPLICLQNQLGFSQR